MMRRPVLFLGLALAGLLAACSGSSAVSSPGTAPAATERPSSASTSPSIAPSSADGSTQTSDGGQVTVVATWKGPAAGATFELTLDTHSVDLDALDLTDAILRNDRGDTLTARPWAAPKGGHHREGELAFGGDTASFLADARWIELILTGIGGLPERTLRWTLEDAS